MIVCIYKIAAVCSGNDLLSSDFRLGDGPSTRLLFRVRQRQGESGDGDPSDERRGNEGCERAKKAVAF